VSDPTPSGRWSQLLDAADLASGPVWKLDCNLGVIPAFALPEATDSILAPVKYRGETLAVVATLKIFHAV